MGAIDNVLGLERRLEVKTSPLVEVTHRTSRDGMFEWVVLFNHSGQLNNALHAPIPVDDVQISITPIKPIKAACLLSNGKKLRVSHLHDGSYAQELRNRVARVRMKSKSATISALPVVADVKLKVPVQALMVAGDTAEYHQSTSYLNHRLPDSSCYQDQEQSY